MPQTKTKPTNGKLARGRRPRRSGAKVVRGVVKKIKTANSFDKSFSSKKIDVYAIRNQLGLSQTEFGRVTGYSLRAIAGWESGKRLSPSARQKMTEAHRLQAALAQIIPADEVGPWMHVSNPAFEGQTPIQVMERGESDRLWRMILQIDASVAG